MSQILISISSGDEGSILFMIEHHLQLFRRKHPVRFPVEHIMAIWADRDAEGVIHIAIRIILRAFSKSDGIGGDSSQRIPRAMHLDLKSGDFGKSKGPRHGIRFRIAAPTDIVIIRIGVAPDKSVSGVRGMGWLEARNRKGNR